MIGSRSTLTTTQVPSLRQRLAVSLIIAALAFAFAYHQLSARALLAGDLEYCLRAASRLLSGLDPYNDPAVGPGHPYPFDAQFPYPLPAALLVAPLVALPRYLAGALFVAVIGGA